MTKVDLNIVIKMIYSLKNDYRSGQTWEALDSLVYSLKKLEDNTNMEEKHS